MSSFCGLQLYVEKQNKLRVASQFRKVFGQFHATFQNIHVHWHQLTKIQPTLYIFEASASRFLSFSAIERSCNTERQFSGAECFCRFSHISRKYGSAKKGITNFFFESLEAMISALALEKHNNTAHSGLSN